MPGDLLDQLAGTKPQPKLPLSDPGNIWNAMGVGDQVARAGTGRVTASPLSGGSEDDQLRQFANQFITGKTVDGRPFDVIGENIRLQQNPALADKVALHIKQIRAGMPHKEGFLQAHVAAWDDATNPNIAGGRRTDVTGYDPQGFPMRQPIAGQNPVIQPDEPNAIPLQRQLSGAATAMNDMANIGFLGSMAAPAEVGAQLGKSAIGRIAKSAAQGAAINAPLSAIDEGLQGDETGSHLGGFLQGAERGAIGGALLGGVGHAALEAGMALPGAVRKFPRASATVGGAIAGGVGGATAPHEDALDQLANTAKGAALGGAAGYAYGANEGRIPGLSTADVTAASERVAQAKQAALDFHDKYGVHPVGGILGPQDLSHLDPHARQVAEAINQEWTAAMGAYNNTRQADFREATRGSNPLKIVNEGPTQISTRPAKESADKSLIDISSRRVEVPRYSHEPPPIPKDLTLGEPPVRRVRLFEQELGRALAERPTEPGASVARKVLGTSLSNDRASLTRALETLSPAERDMLTAFTGKDYYNLESDLPAKPANFSANQLFSAAQTQHPAAGLARKLAVVLKKNPEKTFQEVASALLPEDRQRLADLLGTKAYSASGQPVLALWSNPVGPAMRQMMTPLGGAAGGAAVGALQDKDNRVRGAAIGAAGGAVLGTAGDELLGGGSASRALSRAKSRVSGFREDYLRAISDPIAPIRTTFPRSAEALQRASNSQKTADEIGLHEPRFVTRDMEPHQYEQFSKTLNLDNMEAEATRKQEDAITHQAQAHAIRQHIATLETGIADKEREARVFRSRGLIVQAKQSEKAAKALQRQADAAGDFVLLHEQAAHESRIAADNWRAHADVLRPEVDPAAEHEDWFKTALARHKENIEPELSEAAVKAGVKPQSFRQPRLAYMKLIDEDRYRNALAVRAEDRAAREGVLAVTPRKGIARTVLGERPGVERLIPPGEHAPLLGTNPDFEMGGVTSGRPTEGQKTTGSAKRAEGSAARYLHDYHAQVAAKAHSDIPIGYHNDVYETLLREGAIRPAVGQRKAGEYLENRIKIDPVTGERTVEPFVMSPEVRNALRQYERERGNADFAGNAWKRFTGAATRLQVSGMPVEALSHANTETSIVGAHPGEKDLLGKAIVAALPGIGGKVAAGIEMSKINFDNPATRALRRRIVKIGAARVEDAQKGVDKYAFLRAGKKQEGSVVGGLLQGENNVPAYAEERNGILNSAHHWLFNLEGVDMRARLVLARKYLDRNPHATDGELAKFINGALGNYARGTSGTAVNALQDMGITSFGRFNAAKLPKSAKLMFGQSGLPANSIGQKLGDMANTLYRGPVGYGLTAQAFNTLFTGHPTWDNEPGHHFDVQLPFDVGPGKRPAYVPFATLNPPASVGSRMTGVQAMLDPKGTGISPQEVMNGPANVALGVLSPAMRGLMAFGTGRAPYLERSGDFLRVSHPDYSSWRQAGNQFQQAIYHANPATAAFAGSGGDVAHSTLSGALDDKSKFLGGAKHVAAQIAEFTFPRVLSMGVGDRDTDVAREHADAAQERETTMYFTNRMRNAMSAGDAKEIAAQAKSDMQAAGYAPLKQDQILNTLWNAFDHRETNKAKSDEKARKGASERFRRSGGSDGGSMIPAGGDLLDQLAGARR